MRRFPFTSVLRKWSDVRRFNALEPEARSIVFYAEDAASWAHFEPIIRELIGPLGPTRSSPIRAGGSARSVSVRVRRGLCCFSV